MPKSKRTGKRYTSPPRAAALRQRGPTPPGSRPEDLGFRVFKAVPAVLSRGGPGRDLGEALAGKPLLSTLRPPGPPPDPVAVAWELALASGFKLDSRLESAAVGAYEVWRLTERAGGRRLLACFAPGVPVELVALLCAAGELGPADEFWCYGDALAAADAGRIGRACRLRTC